MLAPILLLASIPHANIPSSQRGSALFQLCEANLRIMDSTNPSVSDVGSARECQGYIAGFVDGLRMGDEKLVCIGDGAATLGTLSRVYVMFMQKTRSYCMSRRWPDSMGP